MNDDISEKPRSGIRGSRYLYLGRGCLLLRHVLEHWTRLGELEGRGKGRLFPRVGAQEEHPKAGP